MTRNEKGVFCSSGPGLSLLPWEDSILKARRISPLVHWQPADKWAALLWLGFVLPPPQMSPNERGEAGGIDLGCEHFLPSPALPFLPWLRKISLSFGSCEAKGVPIFCPLCHCCRVTRGVPKSQPTLTQLEVRCAQSYISAGSYLIAWLR